METVGQIIRARRESLGLLLRQVSTSIEIDQAILSKIERSERKPTKEHLSKIAEFLNLEKDPLFVQLLSEKIAYELMDEKYAQEVLKVAEEKVMYLRSIK